MSKLELLNEFTGFDVDAHRACMNIVRLHRTGNILHTEDNSIVIDMEKYELKGRTTKGVLKSLMTQVVETIWKEYPMSNARRLFEWAIDRGHKYYVACNNDVFNDNNFILQVPEICIFDYTHNLTNFFKIEG